MGRATPPRALRLLLAGVVLAACSARATLATRGPHPRAEEALCCGPPKGLPIPATPGPSLGLGHPGPDPKLCCGKGWGLHCCLGGACCLGDKLVPRPPQPSAPTSRPPLYDSTPWRWKDWAQWLNIIVVILIVALVSAVMVCCCRRSRLNERNPLRVTDAHLFNYGTAPGYRANAPYWNSPSRWVDFSYVPANGGAQKAHASPYYKPATTVNYYASHPADM